MRIIIELNELYSNIRKGWTTFERKTSNYQSKTIVIYVIIYLFSIIIILDHHRLN